MPIKRSTLAGSTLKIRMMLLDVFKQTWPFGLGVRVREVKPFMLRTWLAEQREKRDLKAAGANNYLRMLHGLFGLAVDLGAISENTARAIQLIHEESPERLTPSWQQAHTIIETVKRPKSRVALSAMLLLGLGQAELRNLRGEHFDLTRGCVMVRRQKTRKIFTVPIYPHARSFVEKLRDEGRLEPDKPVFQVRNPREAIALACQRLGLGSVAGHRSRQQHFHAHLTLIPENRLRTARTGRWQNLLAVRDLAAKQIHVAALYRLQQGNLWAARSLPIVTSASLIISIFVDDTC